MQISNNGNYILNRFQILEAIENYVLEKMPELENKIDYSFGIQSNTLFQIKPLYLDSHVKEYQSKENFKRRQQLKENQNEKHA